MIAAIYPRTLLVMFSCLLALATSASAECAWISWQWLVGMGDEHGQNCLETARALVLERQQRRPQYILGRIPGRHPALELRSAAALDEDAVARRGR
jgi:hypothetical protein